MRARLRGVLEGAPLKLVAVILFAILIPSLLVTSLGLVAVFQADAFVADRFLGPIRERVARVRERAGEAWSRRLALYRSYLADAPSRIAFLRELSSRDPYVADVFLGSESGLDRVPEPPPIRLWSAAGGGALAAIERLESVEKDDRQALAECQRLLASSLEDAVLVDVQLAAARIAYRLGQKETALEYLRAALERFGNTLDATGVVRELPILWRIVEVERETGAEPRARAAAARLGEALGRHAAILSDDVLAFYREKLEGLPPALRPLPPLERDRDLDARRALPGSALAALAGRLPSGERPPEGKGYACTHVALPGLPLLDFASYRPEGCPVWIHLLLDADRFLAEARALGELAGLRPAGIAFEPSRVAGSVPEPREGRIACALPEPFRTIELRYAPAPGEVPKGFRGFEILSLATFTWAVIVLVLTILVGVFFTLRSVLREMRTARMKTDFVSFISHELKTPLTAVRMFAETLLSGRVEDEEEERFCLQMIDRESERLSKLIDQILEYSRIEKREKQFKFTPCDMESVVREAVEIFQDHNRQDPREIEVNTVQRISKIRMDRPAMIELFLNLLSNAAKYSAPGTKIVVNLRESIDDISVDVIDQGVGIRKRDQRKIFEKFYRAEDYLTREIEGTGLGLTFARYIAKVHNGDIRVSSQLHAGSVFTVQIRKTDVLAG
ncbi:MAG: ATP-binding protein [Planctomycetota bacterium]